jgi:hypothetical protein
MDGTDKKHLADEAKPDAKATLANRELSDSELETIAAGVKSEGPSGGSGTGNPGGKKTP